MKVGLIGLGKMGSRMVTKLISEGHELVVWNRSQAVARQLELKVKSEKLKVAKTIEGLVQNLEKPRVIWLMLPADATEGILKEVSKYIKKDDIVIDGGNSYYKDTERRYQNFKKKRIRFLGIGVSGGIIAEKTGYPLMVGGDLSAYQYITTILDSLSRPKGGYEYFGQGGAGHFIKMVHNAIEYGYMQSIGEGFGLLDSSSYSLDLLKTAKIYTKGTLLSGFMMERTVDTLSKDPKLSKIDGAIGKASGETEWAVEEARRKNLLFDIIRRSLEIRNESEFDPKIQKSFAAKMVAALRQVFGGHNVK